LPLSATRGSNIINDMRLTLMTTWFLMLANRTYEEKSKEKVKRRGEGLAEEINERKAN
jgi:hypothetical protein